MFIQKKKLLLNKVNFTIINLNPKNQEHSSYSMTTWTICRDIRVDQVQVYSQNDL